ncbi:MAG TPA: alpha/beta hydrolase fold domain-containing protein [Jatrophihabitantaceae bacterium]|jgi:acetyl esterase/lipase|nr:alpha/beta hydrolase fold domain-containing protein [Jatrophihabitantaceae bacterium]
MPHLPRWAVVATTAPLFRFGLDARRPVAWQRWLTETGSRAGRVPRGTVVEHVTLGGRPAERVTTGATERPRAVLYLHGGGYVVGSARMYRVLAAHLSRAAGAVVYTLDYRLAPEHVYPAALDDAVAAFNDLVDREGFGPDRVALAGDSAGGGLAVAAARLLTDAGRRPGALALLSPWTDPCDTDGADRDFVVNKAWGKACGDMYRGDADPCDPGYAPMYGDLSGLPPMLIHRCTRELLAHQIARFSERARAAGVEVQTVDHDRLWHSGQMLAGMLREATDAVHDIGVFLRAALDGASADRVVTRWGAAARRD